MNAAAAIRRNDDESDFRCSFNFLNLHKCLLFFFFSFLNDSSDHVLRHVSWLLSMPCYVVSA